MKNYLILFFILPLVILSCKKDDPEDTVAPIITLERPSANANFENGDTLYIHALITDNVWLEQAKVRVNNSANDDIFFGYDINPNNNLYEVDSFWVVNVPDHTDIKVEVRARDNSNPETVVSRTYHILR